MFVICCVFSFKPVEYVYSVPCPDEPAEPDTVNMFIYHENTPL